MKDVTKQDEFAEVKRLRKQLNYYQSVLCYDPVRLLALPSGENVPDVDPERVTAVLEERDALAARVRELEEAAIRGEAENLRLRRWLEKAVNSVSFAIYARAALRGDEAPE